MRSGRRHISNVTSLLLISLTNYIWTKSQITFQSQTPADEGIWHTNACSPMCCKLVYGLEPCINPVQAQTCTSERTITYSAGCTVLIPLYPLQLAHTRQVACPHTEAKVSCSRTFVLHAFSSYLPVAIRVVNDRCWIFQNLIVVVKVDDAAVKKKISYTFMDPNRRLCTTWIQKPNLRWSC